MADAPQIKVKKAEPINYAPLNAIDNAFLLFEEDYHPMTIGNIWEIDRPMTFEEVIEATRPLMERMEYRRYRQIVQGDPYWANTKFVDDPNFDVKRHIFEHHLPAPAGKKELEDKISELFSVPLDRSRPLWDCHVFQGYENRTTVVCYRLHHALTDGQGSIRALLSVTSIDGDLTKAQYSAGKRQNRRRSLTQDVSRKVKKYGTHLLMSPVYILWFLYHLVLLAIFNFQFLFRPKTSLYRDPTKMNKKKRVAWSENVSLDDIKLIKNTFGGTVNDVLVSVVTGAIRGHLVAHNQPVQDLFCAIPVSMRRPDDFDLRNESTMIYTLLPATVADPLKRMRAVHERMDLLKNSPAPYINHYFGKIFYSIPFVTANINFGNKWMKQQIAARAQAVLTNVPGPQIPITFGGATVTRYVPFIPQHGAGALGMGVVSYMGQVGFGIVTEDDFLPGGPDDITDRFNAEFTRLLELAKAHSSEGKTSKKDQ